MKLLNNLERKYGRYIPENLTKIILCGQVLSYILIFSHPEYNYYFQLTGNELFQGQLWRLLTVLFAPYPVSLLFVIFIWYFFYLFGTALELQWGSFRYLIYIIIAYIVTIITAVLFPSFPVSNTYIFTTLFLAFAHLYPDTPLLLFFIIPVKVKWLGYLTWISLLVSFLFGSLETKTLILLSISNFLFFFARDIRFSTRSFFRGSTSRSVKTLHKNKPYHICAVCKQNEIDNPYMDIRYCSQCTPTTCYCGEHIQHHQHKRVVN